MDDRLCGERTTTESLAVDESCVELPLAVVCLFCFCCASCQITMIEEREREREKMEAMR